MKNYIIKTVQFTPTQVDKVFEIMNKEQRSFAYIIREALDLYLKTLDRKSNKKS